ncbi:hypothetical protein PanWU01x14_146820 [Parasponia andersonii]|uniref:Uncharacterized protein n=1 Tax=Parasponia andersonii TaxID=3476 RepID=A0A2P5CJW7_PARAD|nr:hypothetical protein PanWU01x14_146820 [Parasponia andersonii]
MDKIFISSTLLSFLGSSNHLDETECVKRLSFRFVCKDCNCIMISMNAKLQPRNENDGPKAKSPLPWSLLQLKPVLSGVRCPLHKLELYVAVSPLKIQELSSEVEMDDHLFISIRSGANVKLKSFNRAE